MRNLGDICILRDLNLFKNTVMVARDTKNISFFGSHLERE